MGLESRDDKPRSCATEWMWSESSFFRGFTRFDRQQLSDLSAAEGKVPT